MGILLKEQKDLFSYLTDLLHRMGKVEFSYKFQIVPIGAGSTVNKFN